MSDVSKVFGHFVKYNVVLQLNTSEPVAQSLPNAFLVLMTGSEQQASAERKPLPDIVPEKTSKDKLYNAIIAWLEKNGCSWNTEAILKETSEKDCPSLKNHKPQKVLSYSPSAQHAKNTNTMVQCQECFMWRLVFSKRKLTAPQIRCLETILADVDYSCGALFNDLDLPAELDTVCVKDHGCGDPVEKLYYSAGYDPICLYCSSEDLDQSVPDNVYPLCHSCKDKKHIPKRNK